MISFIVNSDDLLAVLKQLKPYTNAKIDQTTDILAKVKNNVLHLYASNGVKVASNLVNISSSSSESSDKFMIPIMWEKLLSNLPSQSLEIQVGYSDKNQIGLTEFKGSTENCHHEVKMITYQGTYKNKCQMNPTEFYGNAIINELEQNNVSITKENNFIDAKYLEKILNVINKFKSFIKKTNTTFAHGNCIFFRKKPNFVEVSILSGQVIVSIDVPEKYIQINNDFNIGIDEAGLLLKAVKKSDIVYFEVYERFFVFSVDEEDLIIAIQNDCSDDRIDQKKQIVEKDLPSSFEMSFKDLKTAIKTPYYDYLELVPVKDSVRIQSVNETLSTIINRIDFNFSIENAKNINNDKKIYLGKDILDALPASDEITILYNNSSNLGSLNQNIDNLVIKTFFVMPYNNNQYNNNQIEEKKPMQIPKNATPVIEKNVLKEDVKVKDYSLIQPIIDEIRLKYGTTNNKEFFKTQGISSLLSMSFAGNNNKEQRKKIIEILTGKSPKSDEYGISDVIYAFQKFFEKEGFEDSKLTQKIKEINQKENDRQNAEKKVLAAETDVIVGTSETEGGIRKIIENYFDTEDISIFRITLDIYSINMLQYNADTKLNEHDRTLDNYRVSTKKTGNKTIYYFEKLKNKNNTNNDKMQDNNFDKELINKIINAESSTKLASSGSLDGIEKLVNEYFNGGKTLRLLSENKNIYGIVGVKNEKKYLLDTFRVVFKKKRYHFEEIKINKEQLITPVVEKNILKEDMKEEKIKTKIKDVLIDFFGINKNSIKIKKSKGLKERNFKPYYAIHLQNLEYDDFITIDVLKKQASELQNILGMDVEQISPKDLYIYPYPKVIKTIQVNSNNNVLKEETNNDKEKQKTKAIAIAKAKAKAKAIVKSLEIEAELKI